MTSYYAFNWSVHSVFHVQTPHLASTNLEFSFLQTKNFLRKFSIFLSRHHELELFTGFLVWILMNLCIILDTRVIILESTHQVLKGTSSMFDYTYKSILFTFLLESSFKFWAIFLIVSNFIVKVALISLFFSSYWNLSRRFPLLKLILIPFPTSWPTRLIEWLSWFFYPCSLLNKHNGHLINHPYPYFCSN